MHSSGTSVHEPGFVVVVVVVVVVEPQALILTRREMHTPTIHRALSMFLKKRIYEPSSFDESTNKCFTRNRKAVAETE